MVFTSIVLIEFFKAYSFRSDRLSVFVRPFANKWLNLAIVWELLLLGRHPASTRRSSASSAWCRWTTRTG